MAVPRHRQSHASKNSRRAHHAKKPRHPITCLSCGSACLPHRMCHACGNYRNLSLKKAEAEQE